MEPEAKSGALGNCHDVFHEQLDLAGFLENPNRRIEDKADGKRLWTQAIILRMGEPPANKQVPINFTGWICMDEATKEHNIFAGCPMAIDGPLA